MSLNSDTRFIDLYFSKEDLESFPEFQEVAFGNGTSTLSNVHEAENSFSAARVLDKKNLPDSVQLFYSVFTTFEEAKADSVLNLLNNKGTYEAMSEMGWVTQQSLREAGLGELSAAFTTEKGKAFKVNSTNVQGILVMQVKETTKPKAKVSLAVLNKNVVASEETYRDFLMKATDLADRSNGKYEEFAKIVKEENLPVIPATRIQESTRRIGAVDNAREVVRWVFDAKKGSVSDVITVSNKYYFVAAVTEVRKEGDMSVSEVASDIRMVLEMEKKAAKMSAEIKDKIKDCKDIEAAAEVLQTTVSHRDGITFGGMQNSLDPKFIGAVAAAKPGELKVVGGTVGVYVFTVADRTSGSYYTEADAASREQQNASYRMQMLSSIMADDAKVVDNRARFF